MTTYIIAEKPLVIRGIVHIVGANDKQDGYLEGNGHLVIWTIGHLITLAIPEAYDFATCKAGDLPIRPNPFQLVICQVYKDKEYTSDLAAFKQLKTICGCFDGADRITVTTDVGREGEFVSCYIYHHLNCYKFLERFWIPSLADKTACDGLARLKAGSVYDNLYHPAKARSETDWLMSISASRALSIARKGGYSLRRVRTLTLAMVCHRYIENRNFPPVPHWKLSVTGEKEDISLKAVGSSAFDNEADVQSALVMPHEQSRLAMASVVRKVGHASPPLLYDLTVLQKEANREYDLSADKALSVVQSLYEKKITTYPCIGGWYVNEGVLEEIPVLLGKIG